MSGVVSLLVSVFSKFVGERSPFILSLIQPVHPLSFDKTGGKTLTLDGDTIPYRSVSDDRLWFSLGGDQVKRLAVQSKV